MSSRIVELTETQSIVLGTIKRYKCISAAECSHWTKLPVSAIEAAIPVLERGMLIYLDRSGLPKRYCPREVAVVKEDEDADYDEDELAYLDEHDPVGEESMAQPTA